MMSMDTMDRSKLQALASELAKGLKTEHDLNALSRELLKLTVETALGAELTEHLGYARHGDSQAAKGNSRNGSTPKRLKSRHGEVQIDSPRDLLKKHQSRLTQMDDQILTLYAKGLSTREIVDAFKEMYDADVSATLISQVTDSVIDRITDGSPGHWSLFIRSYIWTVLSSRFGKRRGSSTNRFTWHWV
jgi:transposase-like protein